MAGGLNGMARWKRLASGGCFFAQPWAGGIGGCRAPFGGRLGGPLGRGWGQALVLGCPPLKEPRTGGRKELWLGERVPAAFILLPQELVYLLAAECASRLCKYILLVYF